MNDYRLEPPDPPKYQPCPICGSDTYSMIYSGDYGVCGCDECIKILTPEEWLEELAEASEEEGGL